MIWLNSTTENDKCQPSFVIYNTLVQRNSGKWISHSIMTTKLTTISRILTFTLEPKFVTDFVKRTEWFVSAIFVRFQDNLNHTHTNTHFVLVVFSCFVYLC